MAGKSRVEFAGAFYHVIARPSCAGARGRQRAWVPARALLVHVARAWAGFTAQALGRRLHRDPAVVSRLMAYYMTHRAEATERALRRVLTSSQ